MCFQALGGVDAWPSLGVQANGKMDVSADVAELFSSPDIAGGGTATTQPDLWSDDFLAGEWCGKKILCRVLLYCGADLFIYFYMLTEVYVHLNFGGPFCICSAECFLHDLEIYYCCSLTASAVIKAIKLKMNWNSLHFSTEKNLQIRMTRMCTSFHVLATVFWY